MTKKIAESPFLLVYTCTIPWLKYYAWGSCDTLLSTPRITQDADNGVPQLPQT